MPEVRSLIVRNVFQARRTFIDVFEHSEKCLMIKASEHSESFVYNFEHPEESRKLEKHLLIFWYSQKLETLRTVCNCRRPFINVFEHSKALFKDKKNIN